MVNPLLDMNPDMPMEDDMGGFVEEAFASNEFDDMGFGVEMASEEEQALLQSVMDGIVEVIHGNQSDKVAELIIGSGEPYEGISMAAHAIILAAHMEAHRQGVDIPSDVFLGENGAAQETVELLWEVATSIGVVSPDDEEQLSAAYLNTIRLIGEAMLELDDPSAVASAQEFLLELELGHEVNSADYMVDEMSMMDGQIAAQGQIPQQGGGMPPMMGDY